MRIFYSLAIKIYTSAIYLVSPFNRKAWLWVKGRRNWEQTLMEKFSPGGLTIWIHCASLGEFEQGRPVIEKIKERFPGYRILVTFFSPSGYEIRKDWPFADYICYLPSDTLRNASRFYQIVKPSLVIFVKYEFWNNFISVLHRQNVPVYLVSAIFRPGQHFFRWYGGFFRALLSKFRYIFVQDDTSAELLKGIGIDGNVIVSGDTRFDRVSQIAAGARKIPIIEEFKCGEKIFLAGSSWLRDEEIIARYINNYPDRMKWIFAPHEIDQQGIERLERMLKVKSIRFSEAGGNFCEPRVLIIDNIGLLSSAYRYAAIAAIGGGFGKGIHNILEAACWGVPVLFGPNHQKFREAVELCSLGGAFSFGGYQDFVEKIDRLLADESFYSGASAAAAGYIRKNTGATDKILGHIF